MAEIDRGKKMWEILNVVPLIELNKLTPEERAEVRERSEAELKQQQNFQARMSETVSEFFGESTESSSE